MGCLLFLLAAFAPRVVLVLTWLFTNLVDRAYTGFLVPLLGLLFFPYATLFYVLTWTPGVGVTGWEWGFVIMGFIFDVAHWVGGGLTGRSRYGASSY
jgi:hypothetical protein